MIFFLIAPVLVLISEAVAVPACMKKSLRTRLLVVLGAYLVWVALASALCIRPDEFGYCVIPLVTITAPWYFMTGMEAHMNMLVSIILGACSISAALSVLAWRIGYPENSFAKRVRTTEDITRP